MTSDSSLKSSHALVPSVVVCSCRSPAWMRTTLISDTRELFCGDGRPTAVGVGVHPRDRPDEVGRAGVTCCSQVVEPDLTEPAARLRTGLPPGRDDAMR